MTGEGFESPSRSEGPPSADSAGGAALRRDFDTTFLGYGSWGARVWFIGLEAGLATIPAKKDAPEDEQVRQVDLAKRESEVRPEIWSRLGGGALHNLHEFNRATVQALCEIDPNCTTAKRIRRFYCPRAEERSLLQATYKVLMIISFGINGEPFAFGTRAARDQLHEYQLHRLGTPDGRELIVDLRPGEAKSQRAENESIDRLSRVRASAIMDKLQDAKDKIVIAYGKKTHPPLMEELSQRWRLDDWQDVGGSKVQTNWYGSNLLVCTGHPTDYVKGQNNQHWYNLGKRLAEIHRNGPPR